MSEVILNCRPMNLKPSYKQFFPTNGATHMKGGPAHACSHANKRGAYMVWRLAPRISVACSVVCKHRQIESGLKFGGSSRTCHAEGGASQKSSGRPANQDAGLIRIRTNQQEEEVCLQAHGRLGENGLPKSTQRVSPGRKFYEENSSRVADENKSRETPDGPSIKQVC